MPPRPDQIATLSQLISRDLATKNAIFHDAMAESLGLGASDLKCLDLLHRASMPLTPVNLAELTGLTGGAITGVADRLEAAGFIERVRDTKDRRRCELRLLPDRQNAVTAILAPLASATAELCDGYSDDQLAVVIEFLTTLIPVMDAETTRLRQKTPH
jgi:DNA-binding MarR family transcriptional regulator